MHTRIIGIKEKYTVFQNGHLVSFHLGINCNTESEMILG